MKDMPGEAVKAMPAPFVVATLNGYLKPGDRWLDVGCGPGLYRDVTPADFVGVDNTLADYAGNLKRGMDIVATGAHLPFREGCMDLVMSKSAFYQFPDPTGALAEFQRVLRPGGRLLLFDYNRRTQRRLVEGERAIRPCWTQWALRDTVRDAGFEEVELLLPTSRQLPIVFRLPLLFLQEWLGSWAIVTATKSHD